MTNLDIFSYFSKKIGFDNSCKLSPKETICMRCQGLVFGKNKKNTPKCSLLKILPNMLSAKEQPDQDLYHPPFSQHFLDIRQGI